MGRYWPRQFEEIEGNGVSLINEPLPPDNVRTLVQPNPRSLHAVLCEALIDAQALLARLEAGVHVPCDGQRETVRATLRGDPKSGQGADCHARIAGS
jgi:hypothetical protein